VKEAEGAHAVEAFRQHVLKETAEKLVGRERHVFAALIAGVAIGEGEVVVGGGDDARSVMALRWA
jgi:hypothetical protein